MKTCVITGASSGIGAALAKEYLRQGFKVIGIDKNPNDALCDELGKDFSLVAFDLSQLTGLASLLEGLPEKINVFIHSAGINCVASFQESEMSKQRLVLDVNLKAPMILTQALLKQEKLGQGSVLIFIASLSHQLSYPGASVYAASKDGITAFARSLSLALKPKGIHVLTVFPGPTRTPHAFEHSPDNRREHKRMQPEQLAKLIYRAQENKHFYLVPGLANKVFAFIGTYLPWLSERIMVKTLYNKLLEKEAR